MAAPRPMYHQDYIARIRYSNALPPPPIPPKLLDIPNTGLSSGQYTSAGFASRLAREQPLNIEADAELGMPIDLVGMPGVFEGDESVIHGAIDPPPAHPNDRPLLRPLSMLGKSSALNTGVSFLRRTEYITSAAVSGSPNTKGLLSQRPKPAKRPRTEGPADSADPMQMLRGIMKGFDLAYPRDAWQAPDSTDGLRGAEISPEERAAWNHPRHPSKSDVQLLDAYPVLPDPDALPLSGGYMVCKFISNPGMNNDAYDGRLDVAVLRAADPGEMAIPSDPTAAAAQQAFYNYHFFLPDQTTPVRNIKRKFSVVDPENEDDALYGGREDADEEAAQGSFKYRYVRTYETYQQTIHEDDEHGDTVVMALHDPELDVGVVPGTTQRLQKAAYYYPVVQKTFVRPRRKPKHAMMMQEEEEGKVDLLEVRVRDPDEEERVDMVEKRTRIYGGPVEKRVEA
ncbi:hypothetical protein W97_04562 [Coniosporium apollinis CBS 100218]|uniref:Paf1-domain-containing protein n=1 Tax=Coniosporium apollinis (strain CBS 100218) TaxID=1168221 RepID=R7YU33_CONA1|nr:uncharacterized protein W97_04562 [Coniosporium apollinis CBS 100218]EON65324.1 hypothetical protein W97_04562 [Coniosporium apollinis CBS 100218]